MLVAWESMFLMSCFRYWCIFLTAVRILSFEVSSAAAGGRQLAMIVFMNDLTSACSYN